MKKICIKTIGVWHSFEKNETATMFFLKKPSLVIVAIYQPQLMFSCPSVCMCVSVYTITQK